MRVHAFTHTRHIYTHIVCALIVNSWEKFRSPSRILLKIEPNFIRSFYTINIAAMSE